MRPARHFALCSMIAAACVLSAPARACLPPPPPPPQQPGESDADYRARIDRMKADMAAAIRSSISGRQAQLLTTSEAVYVGEVTRAKTGKTSFGVPGRWALVKPVRWIKGGPGRKAVWIGYTAFTSCGPVGGGDAVEGKPGERFVVFAKAGPLRASGIIDTVGPKSALDQRIIDALARRD